MRTITPAALEKSALFRLERAALSEKQLRDGLRRKCARQGRVVDDDVRAWIDDIVAKMKRLGFIDDARTAEARARSLTAAGASKRGALLKLKQKGIDAALAAAALGDHDELEAARAYVRRRRLDEKDRQKALAALARRGFSFDVAKKALTPAQSE